MTDKVGLAKSEGRGLTDLEAACATFNSTGHTEPNKTATSDAGTTHGNGSFGWKYLTVFAASNFQGSFPAVPKPLLQLDNTRFSFLHQTNLWNSAKFRQNVSKCFRNVYLPFSDSKFFGLIAEFFMEFPTFHEIYIWKKGSYKNVIMFQKVVVFAFMW